MMKLKNKTTRDVSGFLLLDKPQGITSNAALQKVKKLFNAAKAGHSGSLDPIASGLLPICFGRATRFSQYLLNTDKTYFVGAKLGIKTTTSDTEGEIVSQSAVPDYSREELDRAFDSFRGAIKQIPSMYSALKHKGRPLYQYARQGIVIEREPRNLVVYQLTVSDYCAPMVYFKLHCSKGTYVRTLVEDFGEKLGCGAHVVTLRRLGVGPYTEEQMTDLATLENITKNADQLALDRFLLPMSSVAAYWPAVEITAASLFYLQQGQAIQLPNVPSSGWIKLLQPNGEFLGIGEILPDGRIAPRQLIREKI